MGKSLGDCFYTTALAHRIQKEKMKEGTLYERLFIPLAPVKRLNRIERHTHLWKDASASILQPSDPNKRLQGQSPVATTT